MSKKKLPQPTALVQESSDATARLAILKKLRIVIRTAAQHSSWIDK